ncbi:hypothetical protein OHT68_37405 [Streptomyces canus]|uniref:hypothetical protein n=1 Tax=Streptomyces canus TaxID=58343 RepID=UPI002E2D748B|nr:hypothetical protein [Streptomyces canus]
MQTTRIGTSSKASGRDLTPLLAGAATAVGGFGALLAFSGSDSPLRAPLTLFFLLAAPAAGIAAALRGFDPFARVLASLAGSVVLNMLVAQGMLATHRWSARGGVMAMAVISALILVLVLMRRRRTAKGQDA